MLEILDFELPVSFLDGLTVTVTSNESNNLKNLSTFSNVNLTASSSTREGQSVRVSTQSYRRHTLSRNDYTNLIDYGEVESLKNLG